MAKSAGAATRRVAGVRASWRPGFAKRFPAIAVTRGPVRPGDKFETYLFNERFLVEAITLGLLGEESAALWKTTPTIIKSQVFDIQGIFRALDRGSFDFEVIHVPTVMARDHWRCHICKEHIDASVTHGPDKASLDHVVPLSKGGSHTYDNVRASHWRCNHRKGARS